jgi:two-component system, NarL family, invasion response regulator UvrY
VLNASRPDGLAVLVVDDHDIVRRGITSTLADIPGMRCVGEAASGEDAIRLARALRPDVVLMDLRMPGIGGLEAARRIGIALPQTRIVAVTAWDSEPPQRLGRSHIAACVGKNVGVAELEATIRRVLAPCRCASAAAGDAPAANPFDVLTGREMQVCSLLLAGHRPAQIARELFITPKTVHTFRYRIFEKLGIRSDIELAKLAASHGLLGAQSA